MIHSNKKQQNITYVFFNKFPMYKIFVAKFIFLSYKFDKKLVHA